MAILSVSKNEKRLLSFIARTGYYCSAYKKHFSISNHVFNNLLKNKLIENKKPMIIFGKMMELSMLTEKGKETVKNELLIRPYNGQLDQAEHDFVLGKIYGMISEKEKDSWITETDLEIIYPGETIIDGFYIDNKKRKVGVEILTDNYKKNIIEEKVRFIDKYCDKRIVIHTKDLR